MKSWIRSHALAGIALGCSTLLAGCVSTSAPHASARPRVYVGWVRFAGEFSLYSDPAAFAESQTTHCVSGALPPDKQKEAAAKLSGKRVRVVAVPVTWSLPDPETFTMSNAGSPITNWCGDKIVLFASEMTLFDGPIGPYR
ncbi:MAG TPA: hypothetical protein VFS52_11970 [Steroidobacteraceae bacterium]|jgi:hypothetical protein|nr:hypothetical protein [Steroidobacteraceae bacterium]